MRVRLSGRTFLFPAKGGRMSSCCFIGHRDYKKSEKDEKCLYVLLEQLIKEGVTTFYFGSRSNFDLFCRVVLSELKEKYPHIHRIRVRAEYRYIDKEYEEYIKGDDFEETFFPDEIALAGKFVYVERNYYIIDRSDICIFYYDEQKNSARKSGTELSFLYAVKKRKRIYNVKSFPS